ncbi:MAG: ATP-dependent Clp protease proteolytic subunit, partial [Planctomycetaceae bacterium]|nr:ATP-dependent Clp protease proteolytic subunit [Planctomycetaceae bacterium]
MHDVDLYRFDDEKEEKDKDEKSSPNIQNKLLKSRTILATKGVDDKLMAALVSQLFVLEQDDPNKLITVIVNSPGGSADSGFAIYDAMRFVKPPVVTICNGICASAAVIIFLGGRKGHRYALPNSRFLIHQPSTFSQGQASDLEITAREIIKIRQRYNMIVSEATGKPVEKITADADRDFWLSPEEAIEYQL